MATRQSCFGQRFAAAGDDCWTTTSAAQCDIAPVGDRAHQTDSHGRTMAPVT